MSSEEILYRVKMANRARNNVVAAFDITVDKSKKVW